MKLLAERLGGFYPSAQSRAQRPDFVVLLVEGSVAVQRDQQSPWWSPDSFAEPESQQGRVALGYLAGIGAGEVWQMNAEQLDASGLDWQLLTLRDLVAVVDESSFAIVSRAAQLLQWQRQHRFCGSCGTATSSSGDDHALVCQRCSLTFYPRISPCIITLVHHGDYCLLGRQAGWPSNLYSTLAGFIEPGESAEQALRREVMEESGVDTSQFTYFASQAWPFPGQLMLGYFAQFSGGEIAVDGVELEAADWFHYRELPRIPPSTSISGQLIRAFVDARVAQRPLVNRPSSSEQ